MKSILKHKKIIKGDENVEKKNIKKGDFNFLILGGKKKKEKVLIENIPTIIWGESKENIILAVHGNKSSKDDKIIVILAEEGIKLGYQVISFDLPNHGERTDKENTVKVESYLRDLRKVFEYIKSKNKKITLFGNSMGAYFGLLELKEEKLDQVLFLSPVVNMFEIIKNMMYWINISEEELYEKKKIETPIGETLYYDYYKYVKDNEINIWNNNTKILYGNKDSLVNLKVLNEFIEKFKGEMTFSEKSEHYFHTEEDIKIYRKWLNSCLEDKN